MKLSCWLEDYSLFSNPLSSLISNQNFIILWFWTMIFMHNLLHWSVATKSTLDNATLLVCCTFLLVIYGIHHSWLYIMHWVFLAWGLWSRYMYTILITITVSLSLPWSFKIVIASFYWLLWSIQCNLRFDSLTLFLLLRVIWLLFRCIYILDSCYETFKWAKLNPCGSHIFPHSCKTDE